MTIQTRRNQRVKRGAANAVSKSGTEHNTTNSSSRTVLKLKLEHLIVLGALEEANLANNRVVSSKEISEALSVKDKRKLEEAYANKLLTIINKILELLRARGLVFSPGRTEAHRFYGSVNVLDPGHTSVPTVQSRRRRVLGLVRETVEQLGRAVRTVDILEHAATSEKAHSLSQFDITHDVLNLEQTGELAVVGSIRGDGKGINLYLPADLDKGRFKPSQPLTWLDEVTQTIELMWAERVEEAVAKGIRPKPFTTGDVRARIVASQFYSRKELQKDPQIVVNAVAQLARTRDPLLRKIKRKGEKAMLWVPVGVADADVDLGNNYANDAERVGEAARRAAKRLRRPVNVRDIRDEIERDFSLQPAGASSIFSILSDLSKKLIDTGSVTGRRERVSRRIYNVGRIGGDAYYCTENEQEARAYVKFRQVELRWSGAHAEGQLAALGTVSLPWVAKGRALLLLKETHTLQRELEEITADNSIDGATCNEVHTLQHSIEKMAERTRYWLDSCHVDDTCIPAEIDTSVPGLTSEELLTILKPLYPQAEKITSPTQLITLKHNSIRRIPNPAFMSRFAKEPRVAAEFLYDRTDALIYAAKQWGGPECCLQAMLASNELGLLRDPRFVFPALKSKSFESRLAGVACLAFLWSNEGNERLREIAVKDIDHGVRQSALWAYGFASGRDMQELLRERGNKDTNAHASAFAKKALSLDEKGWWVF
jgi:hypothetical protein